MTNTRDESSEENGQKEMRNYNEEDGTDGNECICSKLKLI